MEKKERKPWGGRFRGPTDRGVEAFTASIDFDRRLYRYDIEGSMAHARMLGRQGMLAKGEERAILAGLKAILRDIEKGDFVFSQGDEDIHMAIEKALSKRIGEAGGRLHTARSRNDQVCLDLRLFLRAEIGTTLDLTGRLKAILVETAKREGDTILPGYTHLQKAQPILLAHYLLAFWEMLDRDESRLKDCLKRVDVMPLGAAALAGTGLPVDRQDVARQLGFPDITRNSLDAVSDRDFVAEFLFVASLLMMHMSRLCEDLILWSTEEFGFIEIADAFTTGSSIMPQKKNPDVAELIRGKTGRVYGNLVALLTVLKGLPMTYNRDLQEDKEPLFDTVDTVQSCLRILAEMLAHVTYRRERMLAEASKGFSTATDVAEYLVRKGVPFREAHAIVGRLVAHCLTKGIPLAEVTLRDLRRFYKGFTEDVYEIMTVERSVAMRNLPGGTAGDAVRGRIREITGQET